jgi:hypothetical protein
MRRYSGVANLEFQYRDEFSAWGRGSELLSEASRIRCRYAVNEDDPGMRPEQGEGIQISVAARVDHLIALRAEFLIVDAFVVDDLRVCEEETLDLSANFRKEQEKS